VRIHYIKGKKGKSLQKFWNHFDSIIIGGVKKSRCHWCKRLFAVEKFSTISTLNRHLASCARFIEHNSSKKQKTLSFDLNSDYNGVESLTAFSYKESKVRKLSAHIVLFHEYPFNIMEHELFNKFIRVYTPH
jgi:hypothetical protein